MARRRETDSDYEIPGDTFEDTPPPPPPQPEGPASEPLVDSGIFTNTGGVYTTGGGIFGGGVIAPTTGTYTPVDPNDVFAGTDAADFFHGGEGHDHIMGAGGDDWLYGDAGNDRLDGGAGHDRLFGGAGADVMIGGDGNDAFFAGTPEIGANGAITVQKDTILDFESRNGEDDILFLREPLEQLTDFFARFYGNVVPGTSANAVLAVEHGYVQFVTHGNPFFGEYGTTVYIDSNGDQAGGERWAVAELVDVGLSDLNVALLPGHGGNLFV